MKNKVKLEFTYVKKNQYQARIQIHQDSRDQEQTRIQTKYSAPTWMNINVGPGLTYPGWVDVEESD
jgi:hypothetical protein